MFNLNITCALTSIIAGVASSGLIKSAEAAGGTAAGRFERG
jgi:hypothetical protein